MQIRKKLAFILTALMICSATSVPTSAKSISSAAVDEIALFYENARRVENSVSISARTAECTSIWTGMSNVKKVSIKHNLQKHKGLWIWNDVDGASWSETENGSSLCLISSISGLSSGTYRLKSVFVLTNADGKMETIEINSSEKTIG